MSITEREFTRQVIQFAQLHGWRCVHFRPARTKAGWRTAVSGDGIGWPDLFMVRGERAVAAELKVGGRLTPEQIAWLEALLNVPGIEAYTWRPDSWPVIEKVLGR